MVQKPIRAVFLDAGKTILHERRPRAEVFASVAAEFGGQACHEDAADALLRAYEELPASVDGHFRFSLSWFEIFNSRVMELLEVDEARRGEAHRKLAALFEDPASYTLFDEVPEVLDALSNLGIAVGVVSNWSERLPFLLESLGVQQQLQFVVTSAEMRSEKPDRAIFERALFRAGVPAAEALHVGDNLECDVRGALSAGLRAALVDRKEQSCAVDGIPVLADLRGILSLVEQPSHASRS